MALERGRRGEHQEVSMARTVNRRACTTLCNCQAKRKVREVRSVDMMVEWVWSGVPETNPYDTTIKPSNELAPVTRFFLGKTLCRAT